MAKYKEGERHYVKVVPKYGGKVVQPKKKPPKWWANTVKTWNAFTYPLRILKKLGKP